MCAFTDKACQLQCELTNQNFKEEGKNPKVSIIIPIYGVEKYISQALDSVINQTLSDIEIICINDCTPDKSFEIVKEYAAKRYNKIVAVTTHQYQLVEDQFDQIIEVKQEGCESVIL